MGGRILVAIGDAWVDPDAVIAVDAAFGDEDPSWPNCRVVLGTGAVVYGMRDPKRVVRALRHPELDDYDEERCVEGDGRPTEAPEERARRRFGRQVNGSGGLRALDQGES